MHTYTQQYQNTNILFGPEAFGDTVSPKIPLHPNATMKPENIPRISDFLYKF